MFDPKPKTELRFGVAICVFSLLLVTISQFRGRPHRAGEFSFLLVGVSFVYRGQRRLYQEQIQAAYKGGPKVGPLDL